MEEESGNESQSSPTNSQSNEEMKVEESMMDAADKSQPKSQATIDKENRRLHYLKESLKTYQVIKKNIYLGRKKRPATEDDIYECDCIKAEPSEVPALLAINPQISYNCGEKCINRYMCTECERNTCPCEEYCQNRRFQIHKDAKVFPKPTEGKGWGLFAGVDIKKGQFVMQYIGEVYNVNCEEAQIRIEAYSKSTCTYLMKITQNEVIDPTFKGNMARFINHSCDPNCITQKWNVLGETCVGIFAIRDIPAEAELSFDYQFDSFKTPLTKCLCGAGTCKGYLGRKPHEISMEEWEEKLEYLPCSICGQNVEDDEEKLIQCESCHEASHIFCLDPPLKRIPKESWWCDKCKVKKEEEEKLKKNFNPLELNRKLYETVKKKMGKYQSIEMKHQLMYQSSDEEDIPDEEGRRPKYTAEYEESYALQKRLELEGKREQYSDMYPPGQGDADEIRIKKKSKVTTDEAQQGATNAAAKTTEGKDDEMKVEGEKLGEEGKSDEPKPKSKVQEFKEKALSMFNQKVKDSDLWNQILDVERRNGGEIYAGYGDRVEMDRKSKMINAIQLDVIKKNQIVFRRIGTRLFWEHHSGRINIYKKNIETTLMGNRDQLRVAELIFEVLEMIAEEIEIMRGQREAKIRIPAMFMRKLVGAYHNQHAAELENRYEVSIQYSKEYLNDECYPLTLMTDIKVKGVKDSIYAVHRHINHKVKKLKVRRLYCNRRDYTTLLQNLNIIRRKIYPTELRFNKTKEGALKELNHPFYYIQYKDREVALIGTEREIIDAERLLEDTFKNAHVGSDEADFGCVHYLWPTTNMNQQIMQAYKADIEKEVTGTRFVYFEPIVPRKNMTLSIFGNFKEIERAKEILKEKVEALKSTNLSLEAFQEHVKYQMLKYLFKCLHNFFITGNIADIKFWDLQSVEFEKISDMTPLRKQVLRNIFTKDVNFQIYVLFVCDFSRNNFLNIMKLSTRNTVEILRKFVQNTINSNTSLLSRLKCESFIGRDREREASPYSRRNGRGSYNYSPREPGSERGTRRSHERSSTRERERDTSNSRESYGGRHRARHYRDDPQNDRRSRSPYYSSDPRRKDTGASDEAKYSSGYRGSTTHKDRVPQFSRYENKTQSDKTFDERKGDKRLDDYPRSSPSRGGSHSKRNSPSRSPGRRTQYEKPKSYRVGPMNEGEQTTSYYEKNPNFSKDVSDYMSQNERESGYYERMLSNRSKQNPQEKQEENGGGTVAARRSGSKSVSRSRERSKSQERRRSSSRDRNRRRERSRDRQRYRSKSRSGSAGRRHSSKRPRSRSGSKGRNRYRSSSRDRRTGGGSSRYNSDRRSKSGRFDMQPTEMKIEESGKSREEDRRSNQEAQQRFWQQQQQQDTGAGAGQRMQQEPTANTYQSQPPQRFGDLQRQNEQSNIQNFSQPLSKAAEVPSAKESTYQLYNPGAANNGDKQQPQKSRFSSSIEPAVPEPQQQQQQQQAPYYSNPPQGNQGGYPQYQPQNEPPQQQERNQYYSQNQYNRSDNSRGGGGGGGSRFSSKPSYDNSRRDQGGRFENERGGGGYYRDDRDSRDNRDSRDTRDTRDAREIRNTSSRTYESENYRKNQGYRNEGQRRYGDSGYNQGGSGRYNQGQEGYNSGGKKIIITKNNNNQGNRFGGQGGSGYY